MLLRRENSGDDSDDGSGGFPVPKAASLPDVPDARVHDRDQFGESPERAMANPAAGWKTRTMRISLLPTPSPKRGGWNGDAAHGAELNTSRLR